MERKDGDKKLNKTGIKIQTAKPDTALTIPAPGIMERVYKKYANA